MDSQAKFAEISEDLKLIGPIMHEWLESLPPVKKELLSEEFQKATHIFDSKDFLDTFKDKQILDLDTLQKKLGLKDETLQLIYVTAYEQHQKGETQKARALFRFLSFLNPLNVDYWMGLGVCFFIEGRVIEARGVFEIARAVDPNNPEPTFFVSRCLHMLGHLEEALKVCKDALLLSEQSVNAPCYHAAKDLEQQLENQIKK